MHPSDPTTLFKGDGTVVSQDLRSLRHYAGGAPHVWTDSFCGPRGMAFDAAGNLYLSDTCVHRVLKFTPEGVVSTFAGRKEDRNYGGGFAGDGGPATSARLRGPTAIAVDPQGNVFINDYGNARIRKVDTSGIITTVAGNGQVGSSPDGTPATAARLSLGADLANNIAVDLSGNLYYADAAASKIRKIGPDGLLVTVLQSGSPDDFPAIAADDKGNLFALRRGQRYGAHNVVWKLRPDGKVIQIAGGGNNSSGQYGYPAAEAYFVSFNGLSVDPGGNVYVITGSDILKIDQGGYLTRETSLWWPNTVTFDPRGLLHLLSHYNGTAYQLATPASLQGLGDGTPIFFSDGDEGYVFSHSGRHEATIDLETGSSLRAFGYDSGRLTSIVDRFGNTTAIERDGAGTPIAIVAPDGQRTDLVIQAGRLRQILFPDQTEHVMTYNSGGLLVAKQDPHGHLFSHWFDEHGRVTDAYDQEGGHWSWSKWLDAGGDLFTQVASAEGQVELYQETNGWDGAYRSIATGPDGTVSTFARSADRRQESLSLCGITETREYGLDPVWKTRYVRSLTQVMPSGRTRTTTEIRAYSDTDGDQASDRVTKTLSVNGKAAMRVNDTLVGTLTLTSPLGRTVSSAYDPASLLTTEVSAPGLLPTSFQYDSRGRMTSASVGSRATQLAYDANGNLDYLVTPDQKIHDYTFDVMGRLTSEAAPGGVMVDYQYDENGNLTVLANPNAISFGFGYTANNQRSAMSHPLSGNYQYNYDRDRRLKDVVLPSGRTISNVYNAGALDYTVTPEGVIDYSYLCGGRLTQASRGGELMALSYDGPLVTADTRTGTLGASIGYGHNNDFDVTSMTYAGGSTSYGYDADGLLTQADGFAIGRNAQNGLPETVIGAGLAIGRSFSGYGELDRQSWTVGGSGAHDWAVTRDLAGRIVSRAEVVDGATIQWAYRYDDAGRLNEVDKDGALVEQYTYDANGNRQTEMNGLRGIAGRSYGYSAEDHLLTAGTDSYGFNVDGFLQTATTAVGTATYEYSSRGELLWAELPDGTMVTYVHDPIGRRIAKQINGVTVEKYLWAGRTTLLAVYDGGGNLLQRYTYADSRVPVSMTHGGATYFLLTDQVGSLRAVADTSGTIVKRIDYDSFGNIVGDSNTAMTVPFGFAGGLHDRDTGLVRFGYRDYSPELGRFAAKDPIDFAGGDLNLYAYVMNDPVGMIDPFGLRVIYNGIVISDFDVVTSLHALDQAFPSSDVIVTGGDRYIDKNGAIRSSSNDKVIPGSAPYSTHLMGLGVDFELTDVSVSTEKLLDYFDWINRDYPDGHIHGDLRNKGRFCPASQGR